MKRGGRPLGRLGVAEAVVPGDEAGLGVVAVAEPVEHLLGPPDVLEVRAAPDGELAAQEAAPARAPDLGGPYRGAVPAHAHGWEVQVLAHLPCRSERRSKKKRRELKF